MVNTVTPVNLRRVISFEVHWLWAHLGSAVIERVYQLVHQRGLSMRCPLQPIFAKYHAPRGRVKTAADRAVAALTLDVRGRKRAASLAHGIHHKTDHRAFQQSLLPPFPTVGVRGRRRGKAGWINRGRGGRSRRHVKINEDDTEGFSAWRRIGCQTAARKQGT